MRIQYFEIQNFRRLKSVRIDLDKESTIFVGANNSGKTTAMVAFRRFLMNTKFTIMDFLLDHWKQIDHIGDKWTNLDQSKMYSPSLEDWEELLPTMDLWLYVEKEQIYYVTHILPSLNWEGGSLGIRFRLEPKEIDDLYKAYRDARELAKTNNKENESVPLWPSSLVDFLKKRLDAFFQLRTYCLDPDKQKEPDQSNASPQRLPTGSVPLDRDPLEGLIRIDRIDAQRGFSDHDSDRTSSSLDAEKGSQSTKRKLSSQLQSYYEKHLDPEKSVETADLEALSAIHNAQKAFDKRLDSKFESAFKQIYNLGYPGFTDPALQIKTLIKPMDGLKHDAALQYSVGNNNNDFLLPEKLNGLGYQNLISMAFLLIGFRDGWMRVGKAGKDLDMLRVKYSIPPIHLVLIEEPEAHLHVQVQQLFVRKAYHLLRKHPDLGSNKQWTTQLVISTHSSHIAHESDFACLRYFRRWPSSNKCNVPTSTVSNLSTVFGNQDETARFVSRYLKTTHSDLFFADGIILVEGSAEKMLVPHFIRHHFGALSQCYITVLEIGGSHAHRLRNLIEYLGVTTLIITDIDSCNTSKKSVLPARDNEFLSNNDTLVTWHPEKKKLDELLDTTEMEKSYNDAFSIRMAFQQPITVKLKDEDIGKEAIPYTFEDALVFENLKLFKDMHGTELIKKFKDAIANSTEGESIDIEKLSKTMFSALSGSNGKARFALDVLYDVDPDKLKVPTYISQGLTWMQTKMQTKMQSEDQNNPSLNSMETTAGSMEHV